MALSSANGKAQLADLDVSDKTQRLIEALQQANVSADCSIGLPESSFGHEANDHFFWFPGGQPSGTSVAILSSRLSRKLDDHPDWFDAIRTIAVQLTRQHPENVGDVPFFTTAPGITSDRFVNRLSELFDTPLISFSPFPKQVTSRWIQKAQEQSRKLQDELKQIVYYSALNEDRALTRDELVGWSSQILYALSVRNSGNTRSVIQSRLNNEIGKTFLLMNRQLTPRIAEMSLIENGATGWWLYKDEQTESAIELGKDNANFVQSHNSTPVLTVDEIDTKRFLLHWTRRRVGAWPDQTDSEFLDDLIFQTNRRQHCALSSLCRMLACRVIYGSSELTRDERPVVCLSEIPLDRLQAHRVFRSHLGRWDFEPFGIAIARSYLESTGARPVIYGDETVWEQLPDNDRPFFQHVNASQYESKSQPIDWRTEKEWRIVGDLDLDKIPRDQAIVFVHSIQDAKLAGSISNWPVVVLS